MDDSRPTKRPRAETLPDQTVAARPAPTPVFPLRDIIQTIPLEQQQSLLVSAAQTHPDIQAMVLEAYNAFMTTETAKVVDFDPYSKAAWRTLNMTYARLSSSKQYEKSSEAFDQIADCISTIGLNTPGYASYGTKKSALETLRKIGKSVVLSDGDCLGREVRKEFQINDCLAETMMGIVRTMSNDEIAMFMNDGEFSDKLIELISPARGYCVFEGLDGVLMTLNGEGEDEEEEDDDSSSSDVSADDCGMPHTYRRKD